MEKDRLIYTIGRFDHYFESVNNKTAVYIAINTFILGGILTGYVNVEKYIKEYVNFFNINLSLVLALGLITLIILIYASIPYFSKKPNSLFYFGTIGSQPKDSFIEKSKKYEAKDEIKDLRNQVYILSKGLNTKFVRLKLSGQLLVIQFVALIPLIIIFLINKF
ncbi:Pycsar system effector family protein [Maribacter litoralis]|uniref:Pycsar system effector family protein n=1 Tax=Maribacter litoralis TaxID=2059726 RepID=UPI003F5CDEA2